MSDRSARRVLHRCGHGCARITTLEFHPQELTPVWTSGPRRGCGQGVDVTGYPEVDRACVRAPRVSAPNHPSGTLGKPGAPQARMPTRVTVASATNAATAAMPAS